jgi:protein tyrosine phosphatase (PTP) superfamily phosphohydrolase (DUF442 family)
VRQPQPPLLYDGSMLELTQTRQMRPLPLNWDDSSALKVVILHLHARTFAFAAAVILASACASTPAGPLADAGIRNYEKVDEQLSRGAQPTAEGVKKLSELGLVTIINLRPASVNSAQVDTEKAVAAGRIGYERIPLSNWHAPKEHDIEYILQIIDDPHRHPVFVHCHRGADRTGTIAAIYRIMHDCTSADNAIREARAHGMAWWQFPMRRFIREWHRARRPERCKA